MKKLVFFLVLCFSLPFLVNGQNSPVGTCGVKIKPKSILLPTQQGSGILSNDATAYIDRFGNSYNTDELLISNNPPDECDAGHFTLVYTGNFSDKEKTVICKVFSDISAKIKPAMIGNKATIHLEKVYYGDKDGFFTHADASPYYENRKNVCSNLENGFVWRSLYVKGDVNRPKVYDGFIRFNANYDADKLDLWFTDLNKTKPDKNANGKDRVDLYTVTLHEALHTLGFVSQLFNNGNPSPVYSLWDTYLFSTVKNDFLIVKDDEGMCCSKFHQNPNITNTDEFLPKDNSCALTLGINGEGVNTIRYGAPEYFGNIFSHLCNKELVMYPFFNFAQERKNLSTQEERILCKLGYEMNNISCIEKSCAVQANDDFIELPNNSQTSIIVKANILLGNDYPATGKITFIDNSVKYSNGAFTFSNLSPGFNEFEYELKAEGCEDICSKAKVIISSFLSCPPAKKPCNLVCHGDFEQMTGATILPLTNFIPHNHTPAPNTNSLELYYDNTLNNTTNFLSGEFAPGPGGNTNPYENFCLNNGEFFQFPPLGNFAVPAPTPYSKFIHLGTDTKYSSPSYFEGIFFELRENIKEGETYEISFDKFSGCKHSLNFAFSKEKPCIKGVSVFPALISNQSVTCKNGTVFDPSSIVNIPYDINLKQWENVAQSFVAQKDDEGAKYVVVFITPANPNAQPYEHKSLFLDNVKITPKPKITVKSTFKYDKCSAQNDKIVIKYELCIPSPATSYYTFTLSPSILNNTGLQLSSTQGDFTKGFATVNLPLQHGGTNCVTLTLVLDVVNFAIGINNTKVALDISSSTLCYDSQHITVLNTSNAAITGLFSKTNIAQNFLKGYSGQIGSLLVTGTLWFDQSYAFTNTEFVMAAGSKIIIDQNHRVTFDKCRFSSCGDQMWEGIEAFPTITGKNGGEIVMTNSRIQDAHTAIKLNHTTLATIKNNNFSNNYVDVYAENALAKFIVADNQHSGANALKLPYKGQLLPAYIKKSYAAYSFINASVSGAPLIIGASSHISPAPNSPLSAQESIDGFDLGIIAENTSLLTFAVSFKNIQPSSISSGLGAAVYARSTNPDNMILVDGLGKSFTTFDNCLVGVYAQNVRLYVSNNTMVKVGTGVYGFNTPGGFIENNLIRCTTGGIGISDTRHQHILDNDIFCLNPTSHDSYGIWINKTGSIRDIETIVERNTIDMTNTTYGIRLSDAKNIQVLNNRDIFMQNARPNGFTDGINIINSMDCYIRGNNIIGGTPTNNTPNPLAKTETVGIFMQNSSSNTYCCNSLDKIYTAVEARNINDISDNFLTTTFGNHHFGLWLRKRSLLTNPTIGGQDFSGNAWNGVMAVGARNENSLLFQINKNQFLIETQVGLQPLSHPVIETPNVIGAEWFKTDNKGFSSICNNGPNGCFAQKPSGNIITNVDRLLLDDSSNSELSDLTRWTLTRNLYAKLEADPSLVNKEEALAIFYEQTKNTAIANFVGIAEGIDYAKTYQTSAGSKIEKELIQKEKALIGINEKLQAAAEYDVTLVKAQQDLYTEITTLFKALALEQVQAEKEKTEMLYELQKRNESIKSELVYENNLQQVNKVILQQLLSPENTLDKEDIFMLENVAYQCDMEGGEAVQTARAMLSWLDINKYSFDRENECKSGGVISKQQKNNNGEVKIYPNPAYDYLTIDKGNNTSNTILIYSFEEIGRAHV